MSENGDIYTSGKNFTLSPAVTNLTSAPPILRQAVIQFYENISSDLEISKISKSRKTVPNVGNERTLRGLQTSRWPNLGWYGKNQFLAKNRDFRPKKKHFLTLTMFWPRPERVVQRKNYPFPKNISLLKNFGCFLGLNAFSAKKTLFGQT